VLVCFGVLPCWFVLLFVSVNVGEFLFVLRLCVTP